MLTRRNFIGGSLAAPLAGRAALIVDGRHNHDWRATTPELRIILSAAGFRVDVATAPATNQELASFRPDLSPYSLLLPNYTDFGNGGEWSAAFKSDFVRFVSSGRGLVIVHAASSAFPQWREFNEMAGLGGWGNRDEHSGPYLHFKDGAVVRESAPAKAGHHGKQHPFEVTARARDHPILAGLPVTWLHAKDELFDTLRGPARNLELLATAWSDPANGGTGRHEPALFTVRYGQGRVFHTVLGHGLEAMRSPGFIATLRRGAEWAATGRVTQTGTSL
jgi:type 1 glutamine amidotransferase